MTYFPSVVLSFWCPLRRRQNKRLFQHLPLFRFFFLVTLLKQHNKRECNATERKYDTYAWRPQKVVLAPVRATERNKTKGENIVLRP